MQAVLDDAALAPRDLALWARGAGAVGEIVGWIFDAEGRLLPEGAGERAASAPIPDRDRTTVIALAKGRRKLPAIAAALKGRLVNGLITDEATAEALLEKSPDPKG